MQTRLLFISDLHLQPARTDITATLLRFLAQHRGQCTALYILGDLFEAWIGDDGADAMALRVAAALHAFAESGSQIYLMHGNRDFLLGKEFAQRCQAELLFDPFPIDTTLGPILLSHGDALCTDDVDYQQFRQQVRDPSWQQRFLSQPLKERRAFAEQARQRSAAATADKDEGIMDVNPGAVEQLMRQHKLPRLLHGHTHRPAQHRLDFDPPLAEADSGWRLVLGDWHERGWFARIDSDGITLQHFALAADA